MKKITAITKSLALLVVMAGATLLFSFSSHKGGEGFEIFLNNKLVLQQFGNNMNHVKSIQLDERFTNDQLVVKYYHCGHIGKNRSIAIKDAQNKTLKEWKFANTSAASLSISDASMSCKVKDILAVQKTNPGRLNLYYYSEEIPKGRLLANIISADLAKAK
ncbi:MAG: hypothetical protein JNK14_17915 [Chitinophagaceae bacterium]|nr:hypothetical protein [Chitinophagaceae bacterium]